MYEISQSFDGLPCVYLRYNPDVFRDKCNEKVKISDKKRHETLIKWIKYCIEDFKRDIFGVYYKKLFYDEYEELDTSFIEILEKDIIHLE